MVLGLPPTSRVHSLALLSAYILESFVSTQLKLSHRNRVENVFVHMRYVESVVGGETQHYGYDYEFHYHKRYETVTLSWLTAVT